MGPEIAETLGILF